MTDLITCLWFDLGEASKPTDCLLAFERDDAKTINSNPEALTIDSLRAYHHLAPLRSSNGRLRQ